MRRLLPLLILAGCAVAPETPPEPKPEPPPPPVVAAPKENIAIAGLMESARADAAAGKLPNAAASLERALRIEPRNPRLWSELARIRFQQRDYAQAESTALRSESWAGKDNLLRADNWRLIAAARDARGDSAGAQQAREAASRFEK